MELDDPGIVQVFTEELLALHRGQGMEIYWRDSNICPSEEEYIDMVRNSESMDASIAVLTVFVETGGLLRLAVRLMQICSKSKVDFVPLVNKIGVHYQILDDYLNLTADQIADIIRQRTKDIDVKKYAIKLMQQTKTFEYTVTRLKELERESRTEIADLGGNPLLEKVIDFLGAYYLDK
ncbi:Geranylgeranyl pyrophosphate synthase [Irineochytrium annulatum]|nr:Geranylgeranyl pyrophosphate synthase [Irineochytrium annulatum]